MANEGLIRDENSVIRTVLVNHLLALFRDRDKCGGRRSFCAVIRRGGFKVVRARALECCDIVIFETSLSQEDTVSEAIIKKCLAEYINWELGF